jgi:hypothetical protein
MRQRDGIVCARKNVKANQISYQVCNYYRGSLSCLSHLPNRDIWRTYFPHIKFTLSLNREQTVIDHELLTRYGLCLLSDGRYDDAELPLTEVVEANKQILGINHPFTLANMANLASHTGIKDDGQRPKNSRCK